MKKLRKKLERKLVILLSMIMVLSLLPGCSKKTENEDTAPASDVENTDTTPAPDEESKDTESTVSGEAVTIKVANWDTDTSTPYVRALVEKFEAGNPNIKVEVIDIPGDEYTNKLSIMLNGGNDLDAFWIKEGDTTKALAGKGQLEDLNSYIEKADLDLSVFNGLSENFVMEDGSTIALPSSSGFYILYYNRDIFDAAGMEYPSNDMTWEEFEELSRQLTKGEGADKTYGALIHTWQACVQNWAVQDGKNTIIATDYGFMKPYYEMVLRMQEEGTIMDYATLKTGNIHYSSPFLQGTIAMIPMGSWFATTIIEKINLGESDVNWGIARIPHSVELPSGYTVGSVTPIAINAASSKKDAAWEFINYVCSEEGAKIYAEAGSIPSRVSSDTMDIIANMNGMPKDCLEALTVENITLDRPMEGKSADVNQMLGEEHDLIMLGEISIDEGLAEMAERSKEIQEQ